MSKNFRISGTGCTLVDYLYKPVDFSSQRFHPYLSKSPGDGGLSPGKLVFREEFQQFTGSDYLKARDKITGNLPPVAINIGGPSVVSLIHAAQLTQQLPVEVWFYATRGADEGGKFIEEMLAKTPLKRGLLKIGSQYTPFTDVLSDPAYDTGNGERIFINNIGSAWEMMSSDLDENFFTSNITVFGGTALVPNIHNHLGSLLKKAREKNAITVVNTVYDFLNERKNPAQIWPLGESAETYKYIDLLIADMEEAIRLSGTSTATDALAFFKSSGVGAAIITHGSNPVHFYAGQPLWGNINADSMPVSEAVRQKLREDPAGNGDTTGCGDNFAGGVIASIASQSVASPHSQPDLRTAIAWGVVSGGFACFYTGGTYFEKYAGEKLAGILPYYESYKRQISGR
jgi:sugar/nucleoside kinase (ribokinase family)